MDKRAEHIVQKYGEREQSPVQRLKDELNPKYWTAGYLEELTVKAF